MEVLPTLAGVKQRSCFGCPSASCRAEVPTDVSSWGSSPGGTSGEPQLEQPLSPCSGAEVGLPTVLGTEKVEHRHHVLPQKPYIMYFHLLNHMGHSLFLINIIEELYNGQEPHGAQLLLISISAKMENTYNNNSLATA